eukprot:6964264-Prymnesium_polylepis.1
MPPVREPSPRHEKRLARPAAAALGVILPHPKVAVLSVHVLLVAAAGHQSKVQRDTGVVREVLGGEVRAVATVKGGQLAVPQRERTEIAVPRLRLDVKRVGVPDAGEWHVDVHVAIGKLILRVTMRADAKLAGAVNANAREALKDDSIAVHRIGDPRRQLLEHEALVREFQLAPIFGHRKRMQQLSLLPPVAP